MAYKQFDPETDKSGKNADRMSVQATGHIWIPGAFNRKNMHGEKFVELYYDEDRKFVGIKAFKDATPRSLPIKEIITSKDAKGPSYSVYAKDFFRKFYIDTSETRRYTPRWNKEEEMWEIDLSKPLERTAKARKAKKE